MAGNAGYRLSRLPYRLLAAALLALLYAGHRLVLWQWPLLEPPLLRHYLADLLCMPLVLCATWLAQRYLVFRQPGFRHSALQVTVAVLYFSAAFELVLPHFLPRYTADPADVIAYAAGGWFYYCYLNPRRHARPQNTRQPA